MTPDHGQPECHRLPGGGIGAIYRARRQTSSGVVVVGGSEGGIGYARRHARILAMAGFDALALGYFGDSGQPSSLNRIPLECFDSAISWFRRRSDVTSKQIFALGTSRGSEAALLSAVHAPNLFGGVAALVPSNVVLRGWPGATAAWTRHGLAIAFSQTFGPEAADPAALIPVEAINAPLFLVGAAQDRIWPSAAMVSALVSRRAASPLRHRDVTLLYQRAGHEIGDLEARTSRIQLSSIRAEILRELVQFLRCNADS